MRWSVPIVRVSALAILSLDLNACSESEVVQPPPESGLVAVYNQIVFQSDRDDPNGDLYLMDLDGSNVRRFASSPFADGCPAFSPDGTRIAFYSARLGNQLSIFEMHSDGSSVRFIDGPVRDDECPHWSADGSRIGYVLDDLSRAIGYGVIRVAEANGANPRTIDSGAKFVGPVLSPTGDRVLYNRFDTSTDTLRSGIFVADNAGHRKQRIASSPIEYRPDANLDWSNDGSSVLFGCLVSVPFHAGVCVSKPDGSSREAIPYPFDNGNFQETRFSPDASLLVSASLDVSVMPRSGSPRTYLHDGVNPTWLSDGNAVGFVSPPKYPDTEPYNPADIFVGNKDGTGVRNLTNNPAVDVHPSWSPIR
jgi:Tol biopolymer transport system component